MLSSKLDEIHFSLAGSIKEIDPREWDECTGTAQPFLAHVFFKALEDSLSVGQETGWLPQHLIGRDAAGKLVAAAPLYAKSHSYGEYVFDWSWAEAYQKAGGSYYPKWQCAIPFTPVPGRRLLGHYPDETAKALLAICENTQFSSLHVTFMGEEDKAVLRRLGFLIRSGMQYHWHNRDYRDFQDFLDRLSSRKRKMIRKERAHLAGLGIEIVALTGADIKERHWDHFYRCYIHTAKGKWGRPYLTRRFFSLLGEALSGRIVLIVALRHSKEIAAALNLTDDKAIYGRNWGSLEEHPFLHFETCYYAAIEYAILHKLQKVEAGAQGEHKIQRGYEPVKTFSAHYFPDRHFSRAIAGFLEREAAVLELQMEELKQFLPYGRH